MALTAKPSAQNCRVWARWVMWPTSTHTVLGDCYSGGRIYDKIGAAATAKVKYVLANAVVCSVKAADMRQAGLPPVDPATGLPFGNEDKDISF